MIRIGDILEDGAPTQHPNDPRAASAGHGRRGRRVIGPPGRVVRRFCRAELPELAAGFRDRWWFRSTRESEGAGGISRGRCGAGSSDLDIRRESPSMTRRCSWCWICSTSLQLRRAERRSRVSPLCDALNRSRPDGARRDPPRPAPRRAGRSAPYTLSRMRGGWWGEGRQPEEGEGMNTKTWRQCRTRTHAAPARLGPIPEALMGGRRRRFGRYRFRRQQPNGNSSSISRDTKASLIVEATARKQADSRHQRRTALLEAKVWRVVSVLGQRSPDKHRSVSRVILQACGNIDPPHPAPLRVATLSRSAGEGFGRGTASALSNIRLFAARSSYSVWNCRTPPRCRRRSAARVEGGGGSIRGTRNSSGGLASRQDIGKAIA